MIILPLLKQIRHQCHGQKISSASENQQAGTVPGWCTALSLSLQLSALSLPPHGSVQVCWLQMLASLDFPLELPRAALPGPQCAGSPFPTAPSPAGPPAASALSPALAERFSPGSAAPAGGQRGEERSGQWACGRRAEQRLGEVKERAAVFRKKWGNYITRQFVIIQSLGRACKKKIKKERNIKKK